MKHAIMIGLIVFSVVPANAKGDAHFWPKYQETEIVHGATECPMGLSCGKCFRIPPRNKRSNKS